MIRALARLLDRQGVPCPLCVGTARARLRYDADQLAEHVVLGHDFEDIYDWTRERYESDPDGACMVGLLDTVFDTVQSTTTQYSVRADVAERGWGWLCLRCRTSRGDFASLSQTYLDRMLSHRCPL